MVRGVRGWEGERWVRQGRIDQMIEIVVAGVSWDVDGILGVSSWKEAHLEWGDVISIQLHYWVLTSLLSVLGWWADRFWVRLGVSTGYLRVVPCSCCGLYFQLLYLRISWILRGYVLFGGGRFGAVFVLRASTRVGGGERERHILCQWRLFILLAEQSMVGMNLCAVREMCGNQGCFTLRNTDFVGFLRVGSFKLDDWGFVRTGGAVRLF